MTGVLAECVLCITPQNKLFPHRMHGLPWLDCGGLCLVVSNRQVCERIREPSRLDADCVSGDGLHFSFPETYCNIFHDTESIGIINSCLSLQSVVSCARLSVINPLIPFNGHFETAYQRTIIEQYGDWYTDRWWVGFYIWYSEEGPGRAAVPPSPLLAMPNVTAHPSTASVPTLCCSMWHYNCLCRLKLTMMIKHWKYSFYKC